MVMKKVTRIQMDLTPEQEAALERVANGEPSKYGPPTIDLSNAVIDEVWVDEDGNILENGDGME